MWPFQLHVGRYLVLKIGKISQKSLVNTYMLITHVQFWGNVGKTIINHPQFHHFYRCYVYHSRSWVVYTWHCFSHINPNNRLIVGYNPLWFHLNPIKPSFFTNGSQHLSQGSLNRSLRATEPAFVALGRVGSMASNEHTRPLQASGNASKEEKKPLGWHDFLHLMLICCI